MLKKRYNNSFKRYIMLFKRDLFIVLISFLLNIGKECVIFVFVSILFSLFRFLFCYIVNIGKEIRYLCFDFPLYFLLF